MRLLRKPVTTPIKTDTMASEMNRPAITNGVEAVNATFAYVVTV